jgi:Mg-chelatase subunit ChlD
MLVKKNSKEPRVIVAYVLDDTASMARRAQEAIQATNKYIGDWAKKSRGDVHVLFYLFAGPKTCRLVRDCEVEEWEEIDDNVYKAGGSSTALHDSVMHAIELTEQRVDAMERAPSVLLVVLTDGENNDSHEATAADVRAKVEQLEKKGNWTFVFLGADLKAWADGAAIGFANAAQYNVANLADSMDDLSDACDAYYEHATKGTYSTRSLFRGSHATLGMDNSDKGGKNDPQVPVWKA